MLTQCRWGISCRHFAVAQVQYLGQRRPANIFGWRGVVRLALLKRDNMPELIERSKRERRTECNASQENVRGVRADLLQTSGEPR